MTGLQIELETQMPTCFEALVEEGMKKGLEKGRLQGLLIGRIRTLQEVLGQPVAAEDALALLPIEDLQTLAGQLQATLATRPIQFGEG